MAVHLYQDEDATPVPHDVEQMAATLEGRHGALAHDVADFFAELNGRRGDAARAWAWTAVGERVRRRAIARMTGK